MNLSGSKGWLKCPHFENITPLPLFWSPQREHFQHCHLGKHISTCTWHSELSVRLSWQSRNRGEALSDSPLSLTDPHRKIISCELRCGAPQGPLSKTHLPQQTHIMNTAALDLSSKEDLAVQKARARRKKRKKTTDGINVSQAWTQFSHNTREKLLTPEYQWGEIYYTLFFGWRSTTAHHWSSHHWLTD